MEKCYRLLIAHTYNFCLSVSGSVLVFLVRNCLCLYMVVNEGVFIFHLVSLLNIMNKCVLQFVKLLVGYKKR